MNKKGDIGELIGSVVVLLLAIVIVFQVLVDFGYIEKIINWISTLIIAILIIVIIGAITWVVIELYS